MTARTLEVRNHGTTHYKVIKWAGGGEVPAELMGLYTDSTLAQFAIDQYMETRPAKKPVVTRNKVDA